MYRQSQLKTMVNYKIKEYAPRPNQVGSHSFFVEAQPFQTLSAQEMAKKVELRSGFKRYEVEAVMKAFGEVLKEELAEGSAIQMEDENGDVIVRFAPKAELSVSDKDVEAKTTEQHAKDPSLPIRKKATADDINPGSIDWKVQAVVGINFSKATALAIAKAGVRRVGEIELSDIAPDTTAPTTPDTGSDESHTSTTNPPSTGGTGGGLGD